MKDTCIAGHLHKMLTEEGHREELEEFLLGCESPKTMLLWEILFETRIQDIELLEHRIYKYGSMVKEHDYLGREIFVAMVSLLKQLKSKR